MRLGPHQGSLGSNLKSGAANEERGGGSLDSHAPASSGDGAGSVPPSLALSLARAGGSSSSSSRVRGVGLHGRVVCREWWWASGLRRLL